MRAVDKYEYMQATSSRPTPRGGSDRPSPVTLTDRRTIRVPARSRRCPTPHPETAAAGDGPRADHRTGRQRGSGRGSTRHEISRRVERVRLTKIRGFRFGDFIERQEARREPRRRAPQPDRRRAQDADLWPSGILKHGIGDRYLPLEIGRIFRSPASGGRIEGHPQAAAPGATPAAVVLHREQAEVTLG